MAIYIGLHNYTDKGLQGIDQTVERAETFKKMALERDIAVRDIYWIQGEYDVVSIVEGAEEAITALYLQLRKEGNVKSKLFRAFSPAEMTSMVMGF